MTETPRTTLIAVTYNSAEVLPQMLNSIPKGIRVIVVDNASQDESVMIARGLHAEVLPLEKNGGFGKACNLGAAKSSTEFLFFLNPDAIPANSCIDQLEHAFETYPFASAFNPSLTNQSGKSDFKRSSVLLGGKSFTEKIRGFYGHITRVLQKNSKPKNNFSSPSRALFSYKLPPLTDTQVKILSGAALFCRREQFMQIGGFDEKIFLYHEDDDLSIRLNQAFGPLMFIKDAHVTHQQGRSSPRSVQNARIKSYHMARSRVYAMGKHGRLFPFWRSFILGLLKIICSIFLFSKRKRTQAFAFFGGVISMWNN
jgi:N-acetylglucosaminyl-diphospho-decaprenol L-rhamnosyltransferase